MLLGLRERERERERERDREREREREREGKSLTKCPTLFAGITSPLFPEYFFY